MWLGRSVIIPNEALPYEHWILFLFKIDNPIYIILWMQYWYSIIFVFKTFLSVFLDFLSLALLHNITKNNFNFCNKIFWVRPFFWVRRGRKQLIFYLRLKDALHSIPVCIFFWAWKVTKTQESRMWTLFTFWTVELRMAFDEQIWTWQTSIFIVRLCCKLVVHMK